MAFHVSSVRIVRRKIARSFVHCSYEPTRRIDPYNRYRYLIMKFRHGSNACESSSSTEKDGPVILRFAQDLAADRDRPFASLRVTRYSCSNCQGLFFKIEPCLNKARAIMFCPPGAARSLSRWANRCFASLRMTGPGLVSKLHYRPMAYRGAPQADKSAMRQ